MLTQLSAQHYRFAVNTGGSSCQGSDFDWPLVFQQEVADSDANRPPVQDDVDRHSRIMSPGSAQALLKAIGDFSFVRRNR